MRHRTLLLTLLLPAVAWPAEAPEGAGLYEEKCASCHQNGVDRAPTLETLRRMSPEAVEQSLTGGSMRSFGEGLTAEQRAAVARFVGHGQQLTVATQGVCESAGAWAGPGRGPSWAGWSPDLANTRFQPGSAAGLTAKDLPRLTLAWALATPGVNRARGAVAFAGGRIFTGRANGDVLSLDPATGCSYWTFRAKGGVRAAISLGVVNGRRAALFGDSTAHVYAVDAETGEAIWQTEIEDYPAAVVTGSPVLFEGRIYAPVSSYEEATGARDNAECCKFRGSVVALDAGNGEILWKTHTISEEPTPRKKNAAGVQQWGPSGAAIWSAPTVDEKLGRLYVTTGDNYSDPPTDTSDAMMAFDLKTGQIVWTRQFTPNDAYNMACGGRQGMNCPESDGPDYDFGSSAILRELPNGKRVLVAGQKSGWVHAVDPDRDGEIVWQVQAGEGGVLGGVQFGSAADDNRIYVAVSDLRFRTGGVDPTRGGGVNAYDLASGELLWSVNPGDCDGRSKCSPGHSGAVTAIPGVVFAGSLDGRLRAFDADSGDVLWVYDTVRDFETVSGVPGRGGSLNGVGPTIVDGMLFVNSGYGQFGTAPGNVLLAFRVEESQ